MKKYLLFVFGIAAVFLTLTGCQSNNSLTEKASVQERPNSENGITVTTEMSQYPTFTEEITILIKNETNEDFTTGIHVFLEKKIEGTWYKVPMKQSSFSEQGIVHPSGKTSSLILKVHDLKDKLTAGAYRATIRGLAAPFEVINNSKD